MGAEEGTSGLKTVELGFAGSPDHAILTLIEDPKASQAPSDFSGLHHYAVLVPDRRSLASTFLAVGNSGVAYEGFDDHQVSESLYQHDVERNGIEIYADRPRSEWSDWRRISERIAATGDMSLRVPMSPPLDVESLLSELEGAGARGKPSAFPTGARIGHVHLRVTDLRRSVRFYHEKLGLEIMMHLPQMGATFLGGRLPSSPGARHLAQPRRDAAQGRGSGVGRVQDRRARRGSPDGSGAKDSGLSHRWRSP
jgi:catechol 2,3-dioxygenase